jgi:A/G-specific adenine glycosylase
MPTPDDNKGAFQECLLEWFERERREFPWRLHSDPYAILIAEKLLQQTAARAPVVAAYERVLQRYPSPHDSAAADINDLEEIVRPLGFTYRARELISLARALVEHHEGRVPNTLPALLALPGVGDYAARAVLSFGFGEDVPIVDTNVARFLYRLYCLPGRLPSNPARKKSLIAMAETLLPRGKSKSWNLAVLDVCALICKPSKPLCPSCPVQRFCAYGAGRDASPSGAFPIRE